MRFIYLSFVFLIALFPNFSAQCAENDKINAFAKIIRPLSFELPIDCTLGENCHVMNYVDMGADDGKQTDPLCGARTYDTHKGTDFAILDEVAMKNGVNVLAAMDGTVKRIRNNQLDGWWTREELSQIKEARIECGNAVLIKHANDIQTIYCHLKKGSVRVKPEQKIKKGDVIAQVGQSGLTEFPHLHFGIIKDKKVIDPFTGLNNEAKCGRIKSTLWNKKIDIEYQKLIIHSMGFKTSIPNFDEIERNISTPQKIDKSSDIFSFWIALLGVQKNDLITLKIFDPNGNIFAERAITQEKTRARQFYFTGKKNAAKDLMSGAYSAEVIVQRNSENDNKTPLEWKKSIAVLVANNVIK